MSIFTHILSSRRSSCVRQFKISWIRADRKAEQTQAKSTVLRMYAKGKSLDEIADDVGFDVETVKGWLSASNS